MKNVREEANSRKLTEGERSQERLGKSTFEMRSLGTL